MDTPSVVSFLMTDDGTIDTQKQQLILLAQQVLDTPDGSFIVDDASTIATLRQQLEAMGFTITTLPDGRVKVSASGVESVEAALTRLARDRSATIRVTTSGEVKVGNRTLTPGMATGGPVKGPGTGTSDTAGLFRLSNDEHVLTAREVAAAGGHEGIFRIRQALLNGGIGGLAGMFPGRAEGGPIYPIRDGGDPLVRVASGTAGPSGQSAAGFEALIAEIRFLREELGRPNYSFTEINPIHTDPVRTRFEDSDMRGAGL